MQIVSSKNILLLVVVAAALSKVNAFAPVRVTQQQQPPKFSNTRLYESILEAEDRYIAQASQASGVIEKPEVRKM